MPLEGIRPAPAKLMIAGAVAYGFFIYALLPDGVFLLDDGFGYIKSVVETLQHARPWTDEFLEPWAASLSGLSALAYLLTGNFVVAAHGLQALFAAASFLALCALFRARAVSPLLAITFTVLILSFPVLVWKAVEFTGMALYLPCLWWALWAAEKKRWGLFFLFWLLAFATRQSAIAWLVLPGVEIIRGLFARADGSRRAWRSPALVIVAGAVCFLIISRSMNSTGAQKALLEQTLALFKVATALQSFATGVLISAAAAGLGALAIWLATPARATTRSPRTSSFWIPALIALVVCIVARDYAISDKIGSGSRVAWLYSKILLTLGLGAWAILPFRLRWESVVCAVASLALVSLRPGILDYYLMDAAFLCFFAVSPRRAPAPESEEPTPFTTRTRGAGWAVLGVLFIFQVQFTLQAKVAVDEAFVRSAMYERARREQRLTLPEVHDAPFGYLGWHLYSYSYTRRTQGQRWMAQFWSVPSRDKTVEMRITYPESLPQRWRCRPGLTPDRGFETIADETHAIGWFWRVRYVLQRKAPPVDRGLLGPDYQTTPFPLNHQEWRALIAGPPLR